jgi:hypothetical protein
MRALLLHSPEPPQTSRELPNNAAAQRASALAGTGLRTRSRRSTIRRAQAPARRRQLSPPRRWKRSSPHPATPPPSHATPASLVGGGYRLERVTPVDQFVWTPHLELAAVFRR